MEKKDYIDLINLLGVEKVDCLSDDEDVVEGLGLSSLNIINLIILIEDKYKIVIEYSDMKVENINCYSSFKKFINKYIGV